MFALESRFPLVAGAAFACCYLEFNAADRLTRAARRLRSRGVQAMMAKKRRTGCGRLF
jgi:hypothetical protein